MTAGRREDADPVRGGPLVTRSSIHDDVTRELEAHVRMRADELVGEGWPREEAELEARRLLGDRASIERACVEITRSHYMAVRRAKMLDGMMQDVRFAIRAIVRGPGFAVVAVLTLALGIGANTAIFSVVDGVLLEPLPYPEADDLMDVRELRRDGGTMSVSWPNFRDWREESTAFEGLFAYAARPTTVLGGDLPVTVPVAAVSAGLWATLGVAPVRGRLTGDSDHVEGGAPVVVVSGRFWRNQLAARALDEVVLELNGFRSRVVGVVPDDFDFPSGTQVWTPMEPTGLSSSRSAHNWQVVGRLADGVTLDRANEEVDALTRRLVEAEGVEDSDFLAAGAVVQPLRDRLVGSARAPLLVLLGAAGLVLLVACTNLASTLLARGSSRTREFSVRASLGAARGRLVRQLVTESTVLAGVGAVAGLAVGSAILAMLKRLGPASVPRLDAVSIDATVLVFTMALAVFTVLLFGLFPALRLARGSAADDLRQGTRGNAVGGRGPAWTLLVGTEVALALVLIVGSGLLVRSFQGTLAQDAGFDASDLISTPVALSRVRYETPVEHAAFFTRLIDEVTSHPGVASAGVISSVPLTGFFPNGRLELDGDLDKPAVAGYVVTSAGALEALDVPLLRGRHFDRGDTEESPHVAIVSESFAQEYWPGEDPIGRSVTGGGMDNFWEDGRFAEVVGVVGDVRFRDLTGEPGPTVYFPYTQRPFRIQYGAFVVAEAEGGDPLTIGPALREAIEQLDSDVPVELSTQREIIGESMASRQFVMMLLGGFSLLAFVLAVVGIYGVVSYSVATRTREMGIRLALGADRTGVVRLVVRSAMGMVLTGLVVGTVVALFSARVIEGMLYGVAPRDPLTLVGSVALLGLAGLVASWIPARLGTRVDPLVTMRAE